MLKNVPLQNLIHQASELYTAEFGRKANIMASAPACINLMGDHVDYNNVPLYTVMVGNGTDEEEVTVCTDSNDVDEPKKVTFPLKSKVGVPKWANYIKGVINYYQESEPKAFEACITSSIPVSSGLGSSAALLAVVYLFLEHLSKTSPFTSKMEKALICRRAEIRYTKANCGIIDHLTSMMAKKDHLMLIDCQTLSTSFIPFDNPTVKIVIIDTTHKSSLSNSEIASRKDNIRAATTFLRIESLRHASVADIDRLTNMGAEEDVIKRTRHILTESQRTLLAVDAIKEKNYNLLGKLMFESHQSLKTDYDILVTELDNLVQPLMELEGVYGCKAGGGGYGSYIIALVDEVYIDEVVENVTSRYEQPLIYVCSPEEGAQILLHENHQSTTVDRLTKLGSKLHF